MKTRFGSDEYELDSGELGRLRPSEDLLGDPAALRARIEQDGYLYLRGFLERSDVMQARARILDYMVARDGLEPGSEPLDGVMGQHGKAVPMMGRHDITRDPDVLRVLESPRLFDLYRGLYNENEVRTYDYKWLRAVGNTEATGCHMDHVYMGRGSARLMTCWIPFGDIPVQQGTLAVCHGSSNEEGFSKLRATYGRMDVDRDRVEGWFTKSPREITETFSGRWLTDDVSAGDVITFGMHMMHASTTNTTDRWRISCDVRFQPGADPVDPRWVGESPQGHDTDVDTTPIAEARKVWGV